MVAKFPRNKIITLPHKALREPSKRVPSINASVKRVIADMEKATLNWEDHRDHEVGVALAAVQIDKLLKIVVVRNTFEDKKDRTFAVFINPKITKYEGEIEEDFEGCLSIPEIYGKVPRYKKVRIEATDASGKTFKMTAEGFLARVFQHEIDHTKGKLFIDHIKDNKEAFFKLNHEGKLQELDYDKDIKSNSILW